MRKLVVVFFLILQHLAVYADSTLVKKITEIAASVKEIYAPDKRTAFFQYTINSDSQLVSIETTERPLIDEFRSRVTSAGIPMQIDAALLPAADLNGQVYAVANLSVSNNRTIPGHSTELSTQMLLGTPVEVLKRERGYYLVRTPDNYLSWVDKAGIQLMNLQEFQSWKSAEKGVYTDDVGYSYASRSKSATRVSDLVNGNVLKLLGRKGRYFQVEYPDKRTAFIPVKAAQPYKNWYSRINPSAEQVIRAAKTMIGVPYLWGGTSVKAVDCSGLTKMSYFLNGIIIPRDASQQALVGEAVDISDSGVLNTEKSLKNLLPGDLLFFATLGRDKESAPRVTHTAIYIGNGEFIQAAGLVKISSLIPEAENYDAFHRQTLVGARRILSTIGDSGITRVDRHPWYTIN